MILSLYTVGMVVRVSSIILSTVCSVNGEPWLKHVRHNSKNLTGVGEDGGEKSSTVQKSS